MVHSRHLPIFACMLGQPHRTKKFHHFRIIQDIETIKLNARLSLHSSAGRVEPKRNVLCPLVANARLLSKICVAFSYPIKLSWEHWVDYYFPLLLFVQAYYSSYPRTYSDWEYPQYNSGVIINKMKKDKLIGKARSQQKQNVGEDRLCTRLVWLVGRGLIGGIQPYFGE